jgi:outer membrane protein OmpA-like peptidoglycan-associated protein
MAYWFVKKESDATDEYVMRRCAFLRISGVVLLILAPLVLSAQSESTDSEAVSFRFGYREGEQYRIVGVNRQELSVNGTPQGAAEVLTRIRLQIGPPASRAGEPGAPITAEYRVSQEVDAGDEPFSVDRDYSVELWQDVYGHQHVPSGSFVPQVRNVPVFPERELRPGDTWTAEAVEVYDFRDGMGIDDPVEIPVTARYEYLGPRQFEGEKYHALRIQYALFYRPDPDRPEAEHFRVMTARFDQELLWDNFAGRPHYYEETYNLFIQTLDGTRLEYSGTADGRVEGAPELDRGSVQQEIEDLIDRDAIRDMSVRSDEEGVTISLENIQFAPDSAELLDQEIEKLQWVAEVLSDYPDRDIVVSGHTAFAGTEAARQRLSEERARTVGEWLIDNGVRDRSELMYRGFGARRPLDSNETEAGRRRNRRVEITILEN